MNLPFCPVEIGNVGICAVCTPPWTKSTRWLCFLACSFLSSSRLKSDAVEQQKMFNLKKLKLHKLYDIGINILIFCSKVAYKLSPTP